MVRPDLRRLRSQRNPMPIIMVTGEGSDRTAR